MNTIKKAIILVMIFAFIWLPASADDTSAMTSFIRLMSEAGARAFHLDEFSFETIDFDSILGIMRNSAMDYSGLNYDAMLNLLQDPETVSLLGLEKFDLDVFTAYLKDGSAGQIVTSWMQKARTGESISAAVQSYKDSPEFTEMFLSLTGKDFSDVLQNLNKADLQTFLENGAAALLSPKTGSVSETAGLLEQLIHNASKTIQWK